MTRRRLSLETIDAVIDEIDRLHACGYDRAGAWDLARTCDHLTAAMRMSLDGFPPDARFAWPLRVLGSTVVRWTILGTGWMPRGVRSPHPLLEPTDVRPEQAAVSHCIATLREVRDHEGSFFPSPLLGRLSPDQWRRFHVVHARHHLRFLVPRT